MTLSQYNNRKAKSNISMWTNWYDWLWLWYSFKFMFTILFVSLCFLVCGPKNEN